MTNGTKKLDTKADNNLEICVYSIYDSVLGVYEEPLTCRESQIYEMINVLVNTVSSKYYNSPEYYILYKIGYFDTDNGQVNSIVPEYVLRLNDSVDTNKRKIQTAIQAMNFLPNGYFKMPEEMKKDIQEKIDNAIVTYCEEFIENNPDVVNQYQMSKAGE